MLTLSRNPAPTPALFFDLLGRPIFEDSHLHYCRFQCEGGALSKCYLWHVEQDKARRWVLVADGIDKRLTLTEKRAKRLMTYEPSKLLKLSDYPEEWAMWKASGWDVMLADRDGGDVMVHTSRYEGGSTIWGGHVPAEAVSSPELVRQHLQHILYYHLHPVKAKRLGLEEGKPMPQVLVDEMVSRFRRGLPARRPSRRGKGETARAAA